MLLKNQNGISCLAYIIKIVKEHVKNKYSLFKCWYFFVYIALEKKYSLIHAHILQEMIK